MQFQSIFFGLAHKPQGLPFTIDPNTLTEQHIHSDANNLPFHNNLPATIGKLHAGITMKSAFFFP